MSLNLSAIRAGDELLIRVIAKYDTDGGTVSVEPVAGFNRCYVEAGAIVEHRPAFRLRDTVAYVDNPPDAEPGEVILVEGNYAVVRFPDMAAPQVIGFDSLRRVAPRPAATAALFATAAE